MSEAESWWRMLREQVGLSGIIGLVVFVSFVRSSHRIAQEELPVIALGKRMNLDANPFGH